MTTYGGEGTSRPDGTGEQRLSHGVGTDELRARFQGQGRQGLAEGRRRDARRARRTYAAFAGLAAVICLVLTVVRLGKGDSVGVWVVAYGLGAILSAAGAVLARGGRTRWAMAATCVALASLGDSPAFR